MKQIIKGLILPAILATVFSGCEKNKYHITDRTSSEGSAQVKLGYFSAYLVQPSTILYINDNPVSSTITAPYSFPGGGFNMGGSSNGDYFLVSPGSAKIQGFRPVPGTGNLMTKLFEFTQTFDANKSYTYFITDTSANTAGFNVEDNKVAPDSGFVSFKFVNCMPNLPAVDLYKGANNTSATLFAGNVAYKSATAPGPISVPTDSFFVRPAGAAPTSVPIVRRAFAANMTNKRIYTMLLRGYNGQTNANLAPNLSLIVNQ